MRSVIEKTRIASRPLLWMFDYDGTLTPIVDHPDKAFIRAESVHLIARLAQEPEMAVAIVSGRSVAQLKGFLGGLQGLPILFCGLHGGEIWDPVANCFLVSPNPGYLQVIQRLAEGMKGLLQEQPEDYPGILLEDKAYSLVLHYRMATETVAEKTLALFHQQVQNLEGAEAFTFKPGKKILEFLPQEFHKGLAAEFLMNLHPGALPLYFGDDLTDEDAFLAVQQQGGMGVNIGDLPENSSAMACLQDPEALYGLLTEILCARGLSTEALLPLPRG